jgi:hypothetical protein
VNDQVQPIDVEIQELAVSARSGNSEPVQSRHRRIERLDRAERCDVDPSDDASDCSLTEKCRERFDFR